jgi:hypothetical protein
MSERTVNNLGKLFLCLSPMVLYFVITLAIRLDSVFVVFAGTCLFIASIWTSLDMMLYTE